VVKFALDMWNKRVLIIVNGIRTHIVLEEKALTLDEISSKLSIIIAKRNNIIIAPTYIVIIIKDRNSAPSPKLITAVVQNADTSKNVLYIGFFKETVSIAEIRINVPQNQNTNRTNLDTK